MTVHVKLLNAADNETISTKSFEKRVKALRSMKPYNSITAFTILGLAINYDEVSLLDTNKKKLSKEYAFISKTYGFCVEESIIMARVLNSETFTYSISDILRPLGVSNMMTLMYIRHIENLIAKEYLLGTINDNLTVSTIYKNTCAVESILRDEPYAHKDMSDKAMRTVIEEMMYMYRSDCVDKIMYGYPIWYSKYHEHKLFTTIDCIAENFMDKQSAAPEIEMHVKTLLLMLVMWKYFNDCISSRMIQNEFFVNRDDTSDTALVILRSLKDDYKYNGLSLVENGTEDGLADTETYTMPTTTMFELFGIQPKSQGRHGQRSSYDVVKSSTFDEKELFYDDELQSQVDRLRGLLDEENFNDIQDRLKASNLRTGFNILLYGAAGTGKTETCKQLARSTGRDVYVVEVSDFKDKFVGESEKRIKGIFNTYASIVKESKKQGDKVPIMLLNEADAVIGIRRKGADSAVDKMENSVQNIILNEMENIEGILIATTNLTDNLDSAFERRFIYKVKYTKPSAAVRAKIWKSNLPSLSDEDAAVLAEAHDFSGGEIENITRKCAIENILTGAEITADMAEVIAKHEKIKKDGERKSVGFNR